MAGMGTSLWLVDGTPFAFAPGRPYSLLVDTLELFGPFQVPNALMLYVQSKAYNLSICERESLARLGVPYIPDMQFTDIILYSKESNRLYLLDISTSHGPIMEQRKGILEEYFKNCRAGRVYVSVFFNRDDYSPFAEEIAWGSHVWMVPIPNYLIAYVESSFELVEERS